MPKFFFLDDDVLHNELSVLILFIMGIRDVTCRSTPESALDYLEECRKTDCFPDIMFVDLYMPQMNGFDFIKIYERNYMHLNPQCRIIMLTNSIVDEERFEALRYPSVSDFWSKPLSRTRIQLLIQNPSAE